MKLIKILSILFLLTFLVSNASAYHPKANGERIAIDYEGNTLSLKNNPDAEYKTYDEVLEFVREDNTNEFEYIKGKRMCGWFAQRLHNKAEKAGIKAEVCVCLSKDGTPSHGFVRFDTTNSGYIYLDCSSGVDREVELGGGFFATNIDDPDDVHTLKQSGGYKYYYFK